MKMSTRTSPMRLAVCAMLGSLFFVVSLLGTISILQHHHLSLFALAFVLPPIGGIAISLWAESRLRGGANRFIWTEAELTSLRKGLGHSAWAWMALAASCAYADMIVAHHWRYAIWFYFMLFPLQTLLRLNQIVKPPTKSEGLLNLTTSAPIRSEHWGNARPQGSTE
jgi:hypothetical protein